jgi:hypothetical protein
MFFSNNFDMLLYKNKNLKNYFKVFLIKNTFTETRSLDCITKHILIYPLHWFIKNLRNLGVLRIYTNLFTEIHRICNSSSKL